MPKFKTGDTVRIKSGGPNMTVDEYNQFNNDVRCQWFAGSKLNSGQFPEDSLVKVEAEPERPKKG